MYAIVVSAPADTSISTWAMIMTRRRSQMSAVAPAGSERSIIGSVVEACTSATIWAEGAIDVMSQEAPTAWINPPKLDTRLALQIRVNTRARNGASVGESRQDCGNGKFTRV